MKLDWDTAYSELLQKLGRIPTSKEIRKRMHEDASDPFTDFSDPNTDDNSLLDNDLKFKEN